MAILQRVDFDAVALRSAARRTKDAAQARRLLALAAIYDGETRTETARIGGVTLQMVREWVVGEMGQSTFRSFESTKMGIFVPRAIEAVQDRLQRGGAARHFR